MQSLPRFKTFNLQVNDYLKKQNFCQGTQDLESLIKIIRQWELYPKHGSTREQLSQITEMVQKQFRKLFPYKVNFSEGNTSSRLSQIQTVLNSLNTSSSFGIGNKQFLMWEAAQIKYKELSIAFASDPKIAPMKNRLLIWNFEF
ncbi:MAG: hypothetical protein ACI8RA_002932 [Chlamydiales bacterium]